MSILLSFLFKRSSNNSIDCLTLNLFFCNKLKVNLIIFSGFSFLILLISFSSSSISFSISFSSKWILKNFNSSIIFSFKIISGLIVSLPKYF